LAELECLLSHIPVNSFRERFFQKIAWFVHRRKNAVDKQLKSNSWCSIVMEQFLRASNEKARVKSSKIHSFLPSVFHIRC
jgi:hypothetical protein